jgi:hypothetical protein
MLVGIKTHNGRRMQPGKQEKQNLYNNIQVSFFVSLAILGILVLVNTGKLNMMQKKKATTSKLISNGQG